MGKNTAPSSFKTVEIMQEVKFGFTPDVVTRLFDGWSTVKDYAWILHDKDTRRDGTYKEPHIHAMVRFWDSCPTSAILARVKSITGSEDVIKLQHLNKCHRWNSAVAYLTHENAPEKHRYERAEVVSNYDFGEDIDAGVAQIKDARWQELAALIDREDLREYNVHQYMSLLEYAKYKRQIDSAFEYVYKRKSAEVNREMDVIYISGTAGSGKTTFAKSFCEKAGLSFCVSSSSNDPLQDYRGQDVLILDDFRPSGWKIPDLLKLLDNHTASSVKSRYHNKYMVYCKTIIITSVVPLSDVWDNLDDDDDKFKEPKAQLMRRVTMSADVRPDKVIVTVGEKVFTMDNPAQKLDDSAQKERLCNMLTAFGFEESVAPIKCLNPNLFMDAPENMAEELGFE